MSNTLLPLQNLQQTQPKGASNGRYMWIKYFHHSRRTIRIVAVYNCFLHTYVLLRNYPTYEVQPSTVRLMIYVTSVSTIGTGDVLRVVRPTGQRCIVKVCQIMV